jgi:hypothetical protein
MEEIAPGVLHWTAFRDTIGADVHSYYDLASGTVLDPMVPPEGFDALGDHPVHRLVLTNRHHYRQADAFRERFGCPVLCHEAGLHEFTDGREVEGFSFGDELAPGVQALEVGVLTPEETAVHLEAGGQGALAFADAVVRNGRGELAFVPDQLLGDDPEAIKKGLRSAFARLAAERTFNALLMAHGVPISEGGQACLEHFARNELSGTER